MIPAASRELLRRQRHRFAKQITKSDRRGRRSLQAFSSGVCPRFASTETDEVSRREIHFWSRTKLAIGELAQVCLDGSTLSICYANTAKLGRTVEDAGLYKPSPAEKVARHRATDEESPFHTLFHRWSRIADRRGRRSLRLVRFSFVGREYGLSRAPVPTVGALFLCWSRIRAVEGASPYGLVQYPELSCHPERSMNSPSASNGSFRDG